MNGFACLTRARRAVLLAGVLFAGWPAGSALAATTVGQTGAPDAGAWTGGFEFAQTDAAMPTAGLVTSFQTQSSVCYDYQGSYDFQVLRPLGAGQYKVLGDTGNQTDPCDSQLHSYPVDIPVQAGDVIGVYVVSTWEGALSYGSGGSQSYNYISEPSVGDTVSLPYSEAGTVDESATLVESASDLAAQLVTDSTGVSRELLQEALEIQRAVDNGRNACVGLRFYLGQVTRWAGKQISSAQAAQLTADADALAAALTCSQSAGGAGAPWGGRFRLLQP